MQGANAMENSTAGVRKGTWTPEEDILLKECIENHGEGKWHLVPSRAGLNRCRKSCRLRWLNYLKPNIKRGQFAKDEVDLIIRLHKLLGNRWSLIAGRLPGRTANDVKNFWNSHINKKQLPIGSILMGRIKTHKPVTRSPVIRPRPLTFSNLCIRRPHDVAPESTQQHPDNLELPSSSHEADECVKWWSNLLHVSGEDDPQLAGRDHCADMVAGLLDGGQGPNTQGPANVEEDDWFADFYSGLDVSDLLCVLDTKDN